MEEFDESRFSEASTSSHRTLPPTTIENLDEYGGSESDLSSEAIMSTNKVSVTNRNEGQRSQRRAAASDIYHAKKRSSIWGGRARNFYGARENSKLSMGRVPRPRSHSWMLRDAQMSHGHSTEGMGAWIIMIMSWLIIILTFPFSICFCLKIIKEYERAVIFRLGRLVPGGARGPGLFFLVPCTDTYKKVDLRVLSFDVPPQEILSKDSVTVSVDAVVFFHIANPVISVTNVNDAHFSTKLLAQTTMRNILGTKTLAEMLSERDSIAHISEKVLDEGTDPWGVKVDRVEVKDIRLPPVLLRAMAAEAEASRDARARVIACEGEERASQALLDAAMNIEASPSAVQLRYLQTLCNIGAQHNQTVVLPIPTQLVQKWAKWRSDCHNKAANMKKNEYRDSSSDNDTTNGTYHSAQSDSKHLLAVA